MSEGVKASIKFAVPVRRCPYCHDDIASTDKKCVCNACLAVSHVDCWDEAKCCASCSQSSRLVEEGTTTPNSRLGRREQRAVSPSKGEGYELAPEVQTHKRDHLLSLQLNATRNHDRYRQLLTLEGQQEMRARALNLGKANPLGVSEAMKLVLCFGVFLSIFGAIGTHGLTLFLLIPIIASLFIAAAKKNQALGDDLAKVDFVPIPARISEKSRTLKNNHIHMVFELDPRAKEEPESCYPIHADNEQRLIGVDVPHDLSQKSKIGKMVLLVTYQKRAILLEPIGE
jgi:hypothetical protein